MQTDRNNKIIELWLSGMFTTMGIANELGCSQFKVKVEIEKYLQSLKKRK